MSLATFRAAEELCRANDNMVQLRLCEVMTGRAWVTITDRERVGDALATYDLARFSDTGSTSGPDAAALVIAAARRKRRRG